MKSTLDLIEIGNFEDLLHLVDILNEEFEDMSYRLEKVPNQKGIYLFIEDPIQEDEYECGVVERHGKKAYALSPAVHGLILGAYQKYLNKTESR